MDKNINNTSNQSSEELKNIFSKKYNWGIVSIFETEDKLKAFMEITCTVPEEKYTSEDIIEILKQQGINIGIKGNLINNALNSLTKSSDRTGRFLVAEALFSDDFQKSIYDINFNKDSPFVEEGDLLLRINTQYNTNIGIDIYGNQIKNLSPDKTSVIAGKNVAETKEHEFYSSVSGRVFFENNILSVEKILSITTSSNNMEAHLTYTGTEKLTSEMIHQELRNNKIIFGIDEHAIDYIVSSFNKTGSPIKDFLIARGSLAKEGINGKIELSFDTKKGPRFVEKKDGSIDLRETNIIQNVSEGDKIASIIPPVEPVPGKDVFGKTISPPKVKKAYLRPGKNVRVSEDGLHFFSETNGRPLYEIDSISVSEVFEVSGNLDLSVGNIDFNGVVEISGDVEDGFKVKSSKDIHIKGLVGASDIEAGGDIVIEGGCNGKTKSTIICSGNFETKYLNDCRIRCRGDVTVRNEIVSSEIAALGKISARIGSVRGGSLMAKKGIEALDIGSDMGVKTVLIPGGDYELNEKCKIIDSSVVEKNKEIADISKRILPLLKDKELISKLPEDQKAKLKDTLKHLNKLREEKDALNNTKKELIEESGKDSVAEVIGHRYIYPGVILKIKDARREIPSQIEGPLKFEEKEGVISVTPYFKEKTTGKTNVEPDMKEKKKTTYNKPASDDMESF